MEDFYLIKLGGSVITDTSKEEVARMEVIERLLKEIYSAKAAKGFNLIIGHGGGSFPHVPAKKYKVKDGLTKDNIIGSVITHNSAQKLNNIMIEEGIRLGIPLFPFSPSSFAKSTNGKISDGSAAAISEAMKKGFIPIVYGDVMIDSSKGVSIASTEEVFRFLCTKFKPNVVILGTDVDGVFNKDPKKNKNAEIIESINRNNIAEVLDLAAGSGKVDVTGGMKTKISILYEMISETKGKGHILNATKSGLINELLMGKKKEKMTTVEL